MPKLMASLSQDHKNVHVPDAYEHCSKETLVSLQTIRKDTVTEFWMIFKKNLQSFLKNPELNLPSTNFCSEFHT